MNRTREQWDRAHNRWWTWRDMLDQLAYYREHGEQGMDGVGLLEDFRKAEEKYPEESRIRDARMDLEMELESKGVELATQGR